MARQHSLTFSIGQAQRDYVADTSKCPRASHDVKPFNRNDGSPALSRTNFRPLKARLKPDDFARLLFPLPSIAHVNRDIQRTLLTTILRHCGSTLL